MATAFLFGVITGAICASLVISLRRRTTGSVRAAPARGSDKAMIGYWCSREGRLLLESEQHHFPDACCRPVYADRRPA
jgi:hypothetical protein